jgi:hypothetical protein
MAEPRHQLIRKEHRMLQPPRHEPPPRPPVEIRYLRESEPARVPTPVLMLDTLTRMPPATAITIILTIAGMTFGTVVAIVAVLGMVLATVAAIAGGIAIAGIGAALAAIVLSGGGRPAR